MEGKRNELGRRGEVIYICVIDIINHSRQGFMVHKPPEPEGKGCLWTINPCLLWFICYILHFDLSLVVISKHTCVNKLCY